LIVLLVSAISALPSANAAVEKLTANMDDDFGPSLCVDNFGRPHIAWIRLSASSYEIYYAVRTGSSWEISKVTTLSATTQFHISLSLDNEGKPHIAALAETSRWDLWFISWNESTSTWDVEPVANGGSNSHRNVVSLAMDSIGLPHIAWAARWGSGIWGVFYATKSGTTWSIETISHDDDSAPSIALDSSNTPHVLWTHVDYLINPRLQYASKVGGSWVKEDVPNAERGGGDNPRQIVVDSFGAPHIAFSKQVLAGRFELWYGNKTAGSWSFSRIRDSTFDNWWPSLSLSPSWIPYITWRSNDTGNYDVYLARKTSDSWEVSQITDNSMDEGNNPGPSLIVDSSNKAHLAWYAPQVGSGTSEIYYTSSLGPYVSLSLLPNTGFASTTLIGTQFSNNSRITITWDGIAIPSIPSPLTTDTNGSFTALISVPTQTAPGAYTVNASDETGNWATATFTVVNMIGPQGSKGDTGEQGPKGENGTQGPPGNVQELLLVVAFPTATSIVAICIAVITLLKKRPLN